METAEERYRRNEIAWKEFCRRPEDDVRPIEELGAEADAVRAMGGEIRDISGRKAFTRQSFVVFPNGYGASVLDNDMADQRNGFYELAAISGNADWSRWDLDFKNPVTGSDVLRGLTLEGVMGALKEISELKGEDK